MRLPIHSVDGLFRTFTEARAYPDAQFGKLQGGDIRYVDQLTVDTQNDGIFDAGDNKITGDDRVVLGNPIPRFTYSLDLYSSYEGFHLNCSYRASVNVMAMFPVG